MTVTTRAVLTGDAARLYASACATNRAAMANVDSLDYFVEYARTQQDYSL